MPGSVLRAGDMVGNRRMGLVLVALPLPMGLQSPAVLLTPAVCSIMKRKSLP